MASLSRYATIKEYQDFVKCVYGRPNDLHFSLSDMLNNVQRFSMRALKGIRKNERDKTRVNLLISMSWFMSTLNRMHINMEDAVWDRFPYLCSYCGSCPCTCAKDKPKHRKSLVIDQSKRPHTVSDFQGMLGEIYPAEARSLEHAGVHLAEEIGEFSEVFMAYKGEHKKEHLENVSKEAADVFSCFIGVCNSLGMDLASELSNIFQENCHECKKAPCECDFSFVLGYKS